MNSRRIARSIVDATSHGISLCQSGYTSKILERTGMTDCNSCQTPMDPRIKLSKKSDYSLVDATFYRTVVLLAVWDILGEQEARHCIRRWHRESTTGVNSSLVCSYLSIIYLSFIENSIGFTIQVSFFSTFKIYLPQVIQYRINWPFILNWKLLFYLFIWYSLLKFHNNYSKKKKFTITFVISR